MNEPEIEAVAVIGMTGRFPGAANVEQFWRNLMAGVESISPFSEEELAAAGLDVAALKKQPGFVAARGVLKDAEWFDAAFFGIIPKEAEVMDPQQRQFLEVAWEALENAGYDPARYPGLIGVYAGAGNGTYYVNNLHGHPGLADALNVQLGNEKDFLATRAAYKLNLKGPAISVNTACSTSLVAVCQACQSLLNFQCDIALAGGVSVTFPQRRAYHHQEGGIVSPDGHCRAFDADAQGTVSSDGLGLVVLKRLTEALKDGDEIHAVIKGAALNNDGSAKVSFTSPGVDGQAEVIALAQAQAGFEPSTISYIEAHGTATPLGDPIEIAALTQAFGATAAKNFCAIGSVKTNIGHLDTAAGVAGLIKTVLALKHQLLPASLHYKQPNPRIDFANSPFYVNACLAEWKAGPTPRRAGVSSFGLGGTNAHVVLEEAPLREPSGPARDWQLLVLSAKTASALDAATANLLQHFKADPSSELPDAAFTLQTGRAEFNHRRMLVCRDRNDAVNALQTGDPRRVLTRQRDMEDPPVVFMFPGQGAQYVNMGAELYRAEPVFKAEVDRCVELLRPHLDHDLREVLFPAAEQTKASEELLRQTRYTQPALFVIEFAVARLWMSWGIKPRAMIGHSVGEYVAGCLAGVFTVEEALELVAARARLIQEQPGGAMLAVRLKESDVLPLLQDGLSLAAVNSFSSSVVSGPYEDVAKLEKLLEERGVAARRLQTSHAFHSAMMDPVIGPFTELLRKVKFKEPAIPYVSNVTARWVMASEATSPEYWAGHVRQTVRFANGIAELMKDPQYVLLEAGPGQTLSALARQNSAITPGRVALASFFASKEKMSETCAMLDALGRLWLAGVKVDWNGFHAQAKRRRVPLPTYPFERKRFWVEPPARTTRQTSSNGVPITTAPPIPIMDAEPVRSPRTEALAPLSRKERLVAMLRAQLEELSGASLAGLAASTTFAEMGFDSLFLSQASHTFQKKFDVKVAFRQLLETWPTLEDLAGHFDEKLPADAFSESVARRTPTQKVSDPKASAETVTIPLTEAQMEVWAAAELGEDASRAFNQVLTIRLQGALQPDVLCQAVQEVVDRHDALRTTFLPGGAGQKIAAALKLDIPLVDLSAYNEKEREEQLASLAAKEDQTAFDLANGPLVRARVIKLSEANHLLLLATHHIVMDGWSLSVALDELRCIYAAKVHGEAHQLAPAMQYQEYVQWQNGSENRTRIAETENHWLHQFADLPVPVELPADRPRPANKTYRAGTASLLVDSKFRQALKDAAAREGCTLFAYLFAGFTVWLKRLSGQDDLTVGVPAAGQIVAEEEQGLAGRSLVGHCANLLPIRCRCESDPSFKDWLKIVRGAVLDAHEHLQFTFGSLVKKLNPPRDPSRVPLVSTTFNLVRAAGNSRWAELDAVISFPPKSFNIFDLTVDIFDSGEELRVEGRFNLDLFDAATIQRWLGHWKTLLEGALANPAQTVATLPMLHEAERRQLLVEWNNTRRDFPERLCAHQLIEAQARKSADAVAVVYEKEHLTYRELEQRAEQVAEELKARGVGPETLVGLYMERSLEMVIGLLGIWKAGGAYVPLDPHFPQERLKFIVEDAQVAMVLTQSGLAEDLRKIAPGAKPATELNSKSGPNARDIYIVALGDRRPARNASSIIGSDDLAYALFTSGSTGTPKGVQISHRALVNFLTSTARDPGLDAADVLVAVTTLSFDIAGLELWLPLATGARVVIAPADVARDGKRLSALLAGCNATVMQATPATWRMLLEAGWKGDAKLKILCGGEAWPEELARQLLSRCGSLWNMYGPTETTIWSAAGKVESPEVPRIGPPLANTQFYVLDAHLQPTPSGVPGELHIGGAGLARGYLNRPELTAEKFIPDHLGGEPGARLYKTGDLARYQADGKIEFLGRMDQQIKIRGHRIELGEVEAVLRRHPSTGDVAAMVREDGKGEKCLVAYVVGRQPTTANELRGFLKSKLPEYMVPSMFVMMDALPLTPNGKVDRKALPVPDTQPNADEYAAPETPAEIAVAKIWCELLGRKQVSRHDNFFDLGGHSLMATQLISRLETFYGVESRLRDVFDAPTVAEMSRWLEKKCV
jgi:amino acid adenylation domain-containing protein